MSGNREKKMQMSGNPVISVVFLVLAVLFLLYGICVVLIRSGSKSYLAWFGLAVFMVLLCVAWGSSGFPRVLRYVLITALCLLLAVVAVTWGLILSDFHAQGEKNLDYIVVLGAQVRSSGPSNVLKRRLDKAYTYLEENPNTRCIVSGGQGENEPEAEGTAMKEYLVERGIPAERIIAETKSKTTAQNLRFSGEWLDPASDHVGIVTNDFHVYRAVQIAEKCGYAHACGIAASSNRFYLANNMLRETGGILKNWISGNM